jgi:hypothetical protein
MLSKALLNLREGQCVRIRVDGDHGVYLAFGTLKARRRQDAAWWVELDTQPPAWLARFPLNDERSRYALVDREQIIEVLEVPHAKSA